MIRGEQVPASSSSVIATEPQLRGKSKRKGPLEEGEGLGVSNLILTKSLVHCSAGTVCTRVRPQHKHGEPPVHPMSGDRM